jgi:hypothetical protein
MRKYIRASIQNMARDEALSMIPKDTLERIRRTDRKPEIKIFAVAHEGTATGAELSFGAKVRKAFNYVKDMIIKINEKINIGTPIFNRHEQTNENAGRLQIGEVVGKTMKFVGDKWAALTAVYVYPDHRDLKLDVASIEADIEYVPKTADAADVIDVHNISGIALSHSSVDAPAFRGATLLGVVQAFVMPETKEGRIENRIARLKELRKK